MRERLKQLTTVTTLVLVAGVSLVACSGKDDATDGEGTSAGTDLTQTTFFDKVLQAQAKAGTSHMAMNMEVGGQSIKADGDMKVGETAADTAMAMTMETGQSGMGALEMRLVDEVFYLNFGPMTSNKFARIDLTDESNPIGKQFGDIIGNVDPAQQLREFKGAVKSFEQQGKAIELDGVQAQPYVIGIDPSKIESAKQAGGSLPKTLEYTMYIGPDNLPRRIVSDLPAVTGSEKGKSTIDFSKWGEDVSITKPKASEITKKDFFSQLGSPTPEA
jgi:hypothetical protein